MTSDVTTVNVVGLGYVGVEVCLAAVKAGHTVSGIDSDKAKVEAFLSPAPAGHDEWCSIRKACRDGLLSVHVSAAAAPSANVWIVAVPTPLDHQNKPDLSSIRAAAATVASLRAARSHGDPGKHIFSWYNRKGLHGSFPRSGPHPR